MRGPLMAGMLLLAGSAGAEAASLVLLPVKLLDTSQETRDQRDAHATRLAALGTDLRDALAASGSFAAVMEITPGEIAADCARETPECLVGLARSRGADRALFAVVHKSSSLIMQLFVQVVDLEAEKVVARQELNFRGDTDESWRRAGAFLVHELSE